MGARGAKFCERLPQSSPMDLRMYRYGMWQLSKHVPTAYAERPTIGAVQ